MKTLRVLKVAAVGLAVSASARPAVLQTVVDPSPQRYWVEPVPEPRRERRKAQWKTERRGRR